jgi:predicted outer membrane repeat protein
MARRLESRGLQSRRGKRSRDRSIGRRGLAFEPLESRRLLAITVDTLADVVDATDEFTSLREAVTAANATTAADTIDFAPALTASGPVSIVLTQGQLTVTRTLTVVGPGAELLTIDASGSDPTPDVHNFDGSRVFNLAPALNTSANLSLAGLRLTGGDVNGFAGALQAKGNVSLDEVIAEGNNSRNGGALFVQGDVTIANSTFRYNVSESAGGAIAVQGDLTITHSSLTHNEALTAHGGAIDNWDGDLFVDDCDLSYNTATDGGAIQTGVQKFELRNSTLTHNRAIGGYRGGGAILTGAWFNNQSMIIASSTISDNECELGPLQPGYGRGGGGVLSLAGGTHTFTDSVFRNNRVSGQNADGGGIALASNSTASFQMTGSVVENNQSDRRGGGLSFVQFLSSVKIADSSIRGNVSADRGGGIYTTVLVLERSVVADNHTTGATAGGGGVFSTNVVTIADSLVSGNYTLGETARGGGVYATTVNAPNQGILRSTITSNYTSGAMADGGGVYFKERLEIVDSTLSGNRTLGTMAHGGGGNGRDVFATRSTIAGNSVDGDVASGGGLYARGVIILESSIVALNVDAGSPSDLLSPSSFITGYHSLVGSTAGISGPNPVGGTGNVLNQDPQLGPLAYNGGRVFADGSRILTHALLPTSPAIDKGNPTALAGNAGVPLYDERGTPFGRIVNGDGVGNARIDMGAHERQAGEVFTLVVDTLVDENDGDYAPGDFSLREAIAIANANPGSDTIEFAAELTAGGAAEVLLTQGELVITESLSIEGPGMNLLAIDAQQQSRVLNITATIGDFAIRALTLENGRTTGSNSDNSQLYNGGSLRSLTSGTLSLTDMSIKDSSTTGDDAHGGGAFVTGGLSLVRCLITGNSTLGRFAFGGGLHATHGLEIIASTISGNSGSGSLSHGGGVCSGLTNVEDSVISGNSAGNGGGLFGVQLTIVRSTISGNTSIVRAGGVWAYYEVNVESSTVSGNSTKGFGGGIYARKAKISDSTISGNSAGPISGFGGGMRVGNVSVIRSSIVYNRAGGRGGAIDGSGSILDSIITLNSSGEGLPEVSLANHFTIRHSIMGDATGTNLVEAPVGTPDANGNLIGGPIHGVIDPKLGPLANNGAATKTHALLPGSPAINAGDPAAVAGMNGVPEFDQRGGPWSRVVGARIDMGAVEAQANPLAGDYNFNGVVDAADYSVWRDTLGASNDLRADGSGAVVGVPDGVVDELDYVLWKANFGNVLEVGGAGSGALAGELRLAGTEVGDTDENVNVMVEGGGAALNLLAPSSDSVETGRERDRRGVARRLLFTSAGRDGALAEWVAARTRLPSTSDLAEPESNGTPTACDESLTETDRVFALLGDA